MSLRNRLLALSLLTLLLPWSGWKLLQELEQFLREAQEAALLSGARSLAASLPFDVRSGLLYVPEPYLVLRSLGAAPMVDGLVDDWPDPQQGLELSSPDGRSRARVLAAHTGSGLALLIDVQQAAVVAGQRAPGQQASGQQVPGVAAIELLLRSPRGLQRYNISPEAPGPLQLQGEGGSGQVEGYWRDTADGYRVELALPAQARNADIMLTIPDGRGGVLRPGDGRAAATRPIAPPGAPLGAPPGAPPNATPGAPPHATPAPQVPQPQPLQPQAMQQQAPPWITLISPAAVSARDLAAAVPADSRAWLVDRQGWVLADSGAPDPAIASQTTWAQRLLYRLVAGRRTAMESPAEEPQVRMADPVVRAALQQREATAWSQDPETAVVRNTVAVPVVLEGQVRGALVMQTATEGLLLVTNRALGRLLLTTLVITFGLAGGLWYFATRLSQRVRRLSGAVSAAMENGVVTGTLPLLHDRDELGDLARNNDRLLRALADYNQYLQTLAGKLSHELKTPLAITRSSLENLASRPLDEDARRFLERAREGLERQAQIVRAMSEASRLEAAIRAAEWEQADLADLLRRCAEGYQAVHPGRRIEIDIPPGPMPLWCAPDLLAQALDKLVDNAVSLSGAEDRVCLGLRRQAESCVLTVSNTGSRLPDELQDHLFDSLVSLRTRRGDAPHLGLGLYIVRLVASAHGGTAQARNLAEGQGVAFDITLAIRRPAAQPAG